MFGVSNSMLKNKKNAEYLSMREKINGNDLDDQIIGMKFFRDFISNEPEITIHPSLYSRIHSLFKESENIILKTEASFIFANCFDGSAHEESIKLLKNENIIRSLVCTIFRYPNEYDLIHGCVWSLNNYAVKSAENRDVVIHSHVVPSLMQLLSDLDLPTELLSNILWLIHNLSRGHPKPNRDFIVPLIPTLAALYQHEDLEIVEHALWIAFYVTEDSNSKLINQWFLSDKKMPVVSGITVSEEVITINHSIALINLLDRLSQSEVVGLKPAVMLAGNLLHIDEQENSHHTFYRNIVAPLLNVLQRTQDFVCPEVSNQSLWALEQIIAKSPYQIQKILALDDSVTLLEKLMNHNDASVRHESTYCLLSMICNGTIEQSNKILKHTNIRIRFGQYFSNLNPEHKANYTVISMFLVAFKRLQVCCDTKDVFCDDLIKHLVPYISDSPTSTIPKEFQRDCKQIFEYYRKMQPAISSIKPRLIKVRI
ncbi:hypothetical protein PPL_10993 [Heterostelium album PN500]|uniref:Importin subunit alpha n=1 Tax=Heterostelium pallidum (strain ATCC 26659 / Pp 5 / PN500) TaxID=670386 RepID=D3BSM4_HETP5|nr:hypothetical protein PPL_10993 [Heterostelium album PN500]EFA75489.1 hypothetical protein PPL_10993 [Heterostelium album PN500]|eukprot:XP_020427623.1 hypothetical protein PPL_10993 [Heterostelium album PN500]